MAVPKNDQRRILYIAGQYGLDASIITHLEDVDLTDTEAISEALLSVTQGQWERPVYSPASIAAFAAALQDVPDEVPVGTTDEAP